MAGTNERDPIGLKVRELRLVHGLTQRELAEQAGITLMAVSRIELGSRLPSPPTIRALARALGVDPGILFRLPIHPEPGERPRKAPRTRKQT